MKSTNLKCTNWKVLINQNTLVPSSLKHRTLTTRKLSSFPIINSTPVSNHHFEFYCHRLVLLALELLAEWNQIVYTHVFWFLLINIILRFICVVMCTSVVDSLLWLFSIPWYEYLSHDLLVSCWWIFDCFEIMNKAAIKKSLEEVFWGACFHFSQENTKEWNWWICLTLYETVK